LLRNELWDNWEKMQLRRVFDEVAGRKLKREFIYSYGGAQTKENLKIRT
jgi:hypothetical protein